MSTIQSTALECHKSTSQVLRRSEDSALATGHSAAACATIPRSLPSLSRLDRRRIVAAHTRGSTRTASSQARLGSRRASSLHRDSSYTVQAWANQRAFGQPQGPCKGLCAMPRSPTHRRLKTTEISGGSLRRAVLCNEKGSVRRTGACPSICARAHTEPCDTNKEALGDCVRVPAQMWEGRTCGYQRLRTKKLCHVPLRLHVKHLAS